MKQFVAAALAAVLALASDPDSDAHKSMEELCAKYGYQSENYTLTTSDGYILSLYRIPGLVSETETAGKPAVLFMHCQDCDMMEWVFNEPAVAPAFVLANEGYDVWMGNNRGSKYSATHVDKNPKHKAYWDFYQEDMARIDTPTFIDFILDTTKHSTLSYIGHSEGTTQMFMGASLMPEYYNARINVFAALAPVASTANIPSTPIRLAANHIGLIEFQLVDVLRMFNLFSPMPDAAAGVVLLCNMLSLFGVCEYFNHTLLNHHGVDNPDRFDVYMSNVPSGAGYRTFIYYAQMIESGRFALYDYGRRENKSRYGQDPPPLVPIETDYNIPTALFSGSLDNLADPVDVANLSRWISDKIVFQKQYHLDHFSFVIAKDMSYFTEDVVSVLQKFNPTNKSLFLQ